MIERSFSGNLLPCDGEADYFGPIMPAAEQERFFQALATGIEWRHDETVMFGKRIVTARKVAWYGDMDFRYAYSGTEKRALPWTKELRELKAIVEKVAGCAFNSCLLNLYHNGTEGMGWHSDDEKELVKGAAIASVSLGAGRKFRFKHKREPEKRAEIFLDPGSLLVMRGGTQANWLHELPKMRRVTEPRINLTFREIVS